MSAWRLGLKETIGNIGEKGARIEVVERGPVRGIIRVTSPFRNSRFVQDIVLYQGIPRLDCRMRLDWQERNVMVKAAFPAALTNASAAFEIPYGFVSRPADGTEVPALRWIDLTDESGGYGLSLLNDSKYGFDVKNSRARISIIHGATSPDPEADRGEHELLYSIFPHAGSWQAAGTHRKGYELNNPLLARVGMLHQGSLPATHSFIQAGPENVIVSSLKKETGYENRAMILRIYEMFGRSADVELSFPWSIEAWDTDLIERPLSRIDSGVRMLNFSLKPFEVRTIKLISKPRR
jgi:alpha-mannosidase